MNSFPNSDSVSISIIIPTYNEEESILQLLNHLKAHSNNLVEDYIVADGGSSDRTVQIVRDAGFMCIECKEKGRASQMNRGYELSSGSVLYFVHADSFPPVSYAEDILESLRLGYQAGCYRFRFNSDRLMLRINSFFTRFNRIMCRGGDQTLFLTRNLFEQLEGFRNDFMIMEDYDLIQKIQKKAAFRIIPKDVIVSARKYRDNSWFKVNFANLVVFLLYFSGAEQSTMINAYKKLIRHPKFD